MPTMAVNLLEDSKFWRELELSARDMGGEMNAASEVYARGVNVKGLEKYDCLVGYHAD